MTSSGELGKHKPILWHNLWHNNYVVATRRSKTPHKRIQESRREVERWRTRERDSGPGRGGSRGGATRPLLKSDWPLIGPPSINRRREEQPENFSTTITDAIPPRNNWRHCGSYVPM